MAVVYQSNDDHKIEALLMAFGNLHSKCQWNGKGMYDMVQNILQNFVYSSLKS